MWRSRPSPCYLSCSSTHLPLPKRALCPSRSALVLPPEGFRLQDELRFIEDVSRSLKSSFTFFLIFRASSSKRSLRSSDSSLITVSFVLLDNAARFLLINVPVSSKFIALSTHFTSFPFVSWRQQLPVFHWSSDCRRRYTDLQPTIISCPWPSSLTSMVILFDMLFFRRVIRLLLRTIDRELDGDLRPMLTI